MATVDPKPKRMPNFSAADSLLISQIMGTDSGIEGLTFYAYTKHRFTKTITASSKKRIWNKITETFNSSAEVSRDCISIMKKWDNLVHTHRLAYSEYASQIQKTGGGTNPKNLSTLTEAVMDVVGRQSQAILGAASEQLDSSMLMTSQMRNSCANYNEASSEVDISFSTSSTSVDNGDDLIRPGGIDVVCCNCRCHRRLEALKEEKVRLQIKALKRQLGEE